MPVWPFRRRRGQTLQDGSVSAPVSRQATAILTPDATDKPRETNPFDDPAATRSEKIPNRRKASFPGAALPVGPLSPTLPRLVASDDIIHERKNSNEDVTALPATHVLPQSPHLRTASLGRAPIPYNFHRQSSTPSTSQQASEPASRAVSPVSKRSARPYATLVRKASDRSKRSYQGGAIHEEDIRELSAPIAIPQQRRDGVLQGDAQRLRPKDSSVTLPAEGSLRSSMTGWIEQRGWEVSNFAIINPRPLVRASATMGFAPSSLPAEPPSGVLYRIDSIRAEGGKAPVTRDANKKKKKYQPVGEEADELDASELRAIMERDAKRRERRDKDLADKLDRKLKRQATQQQQQTEASARRRDGDLTAEEIRSRVDEERSARVMTPLTDVHPALRSQTSFPFDGSASAAPSRGPVSPIDTFIPDSPTVPPRDLGISVEQPSTSENQQNPFVDPDNDNADTFTLAPEEALEVPAGPSVAPSTARTSYEEAEIATVQTLRMSLTATPPLSPVRSRISTANDPRQSLTNNTFEPSRLSEVLRQSSVTTDTARASTYTSESSLPTPTSPVQEKRSTPWASFFRRGTTARKRSVVSTTTNNNNKDLLASDPSFSNTSRDSLRAHSIPAHLADLPPPPVIRPPGAAIRTTSGPPIRTQSRFREDLPELPSVPSPAISRTVTPDVLLTASAAAAAAATKRNGKSPEIDTGDAFSSRPIQSDRQRSFLAQPDASFEHLGPTNASSSAAGIIDTDAAYLRRNNSAGTHRVSALLPGDSATTPAQQYHEISRPVSPLSDDGNLVQAERPVEPITSFGSVRRKATLVEGDLSVQRSREGLVTEFLDGGGGNSPQQQQPQHLSTAAPATAAAAAAGGGGVSPITPTAPSTNNNSPHLGSSSSSPDDDDYVEGVTPAAGETPVLVETELRHAKSVSYTGGHSRQFSAGSARLLDVRRSTVDADRPGTGEGEEGERERLGTGTKEEGNEEGK